MGKDKKCAYKRCYFEPKKSPRLCPYLVKRNEWENDLKNYNNHLKKIFYAKPLIDDSPIFMNPYARLAVTKLKNNAKRLQQLDKENKYILQRLIEVNRLGGLVDHLNDQIYRYRVTKWKAEQGRRLKMKIENEYLAERLCRTKSYYGWQEHMDKWKVTKKVLEWTAKFPFILSKKPNLDEILRAEPTISSSLDQLGIRLQCFMEFQVKGGENLGRIVIEIYHDHVPVTARNFFHICRGDYGFSYKNCPIHRISKNRYLETGDITKGTGSGGISIYGKTFDEEKHSLKHTKAGVLSMIRVGKQQNNSKFAITFGEMQQWDRRNVVFGKVIQGAEVLMKINGYGREIGRPLERIFISKCGGLDSGDLVLN
ncbi:peptidyl-prolyl cis-trans isomerase E-like [Harmonia axyridis]|uniref:peptidyl-prolyl cis-trans isomerase E-like n=1 Tax=Harmonia axyridis TaxID=115357 RepID=UPI001E2785D3|nr:peptidyl-prolyl cis-trans isomerase E-like [Harmonia axyridis]